MSESKKTISLKLWHFVAALGSTLFTLLGGGIGLYAQSQDIIQKRSEIEKIREETASVIATKDAEIKRLTAETDKFKKEGIRIDKVEGRDEERHISGLYKNISSPDITERQGALNNISKHVNEGKEDGIKAIEKLAAQIRTQDSVFKKKGNSVANNVNEKLPQDRDKTQVLLNAIINISATGKDLRNRESMNLIGLNHANLYGASLISDVENKKIRLYLSFNHSIMNGSILRGLDLRNSSLVDTGLDGSGLQGTNLSSTNLSKSSLVGADLSGADLSGANLTKSNLKNAKLKNANLRHTNISNSANITSKQISQACYGEEAIGVGKLKPKSPSPERTNECNNIWHDE
jgi:uncharacterized protein YjbI with pentapeptide repeats